MSVPPPYQCIGGYKGWEEGRLSVCLTPAGLSNSPLTIQVRPKSIGVSVMRDPVICDVHYHTGSTFHLVEGVRADVGLQAEERMKQIYKEKQR